MTPDVELFRLVAEDHTFEYEPGQHTTIHFEDGGEKVTRPYTRIGSSPRAGSLTRPTIDDSDDFGGGRPDRAR